MIVSQYRQIAQETAARYGVPFDVVDSLIMSESGYRQIWSQKKENGELVDNKRGGYGVMQLTGATAKDLGVNRFDVRENIDGGIRLIKKYLEEYGGNPALLWSAYKTGPNSEQTINLLQGKIDKIKTDFSAPYREMVTTIENFDLIAIFKQASWGALLLTLGGLSIYYGMGGLIRGYAR